MQVALIAPKTMLKWTKLGDMHFIVPPTADAKFYAGERTYKILDNGTYELGKPLPTKEFLDLACKLYVDEIIVPDVLFDAIETFRNAQWFFEKHSDFPAKKMIVPQAATPPEYVFAYQTFTNRFPEADVIGVPKWLDFKFHCRAAMLHYLARQELLDPRPHHLLGVDSLADLMMYGRLPNIRSCDTSMPFTYAYHGKRLLHFSTEQLERIPLHAGKILNERLLEVNILVLKEVAHWSNST